MFAGQQILQRYYWNLAVLSYLEADAVCPNSVSGQYSPEFHLTGHHPDIGNRFRFYFGEPVVSVILKQQKSKVTFQPRGEFAVAIASGPGSNNSVLVLIPSRSRHRLYVRYDVRHIKSSEFVPLIRSQAELEAIIPTVLEDGTVKIPPVKLPMRSPFDINVHPSLLPLQDLPQDAPLNESILISNIPPSPDPNTWKFESNSRESPLTSTELTHDDESAHDAPVAHRTRSSVNSFFYNEDIPPPPENSDFWDDPPDFEVDNVESDDDHYSKRARITQFYIQAVKKAEKTEEQCDLDGEDVSLRYAQASAEWDTLWKGAAKAEFLVLKDNGTGHEVAFEDIPKDEPILPSKMIFKKKRAVTAEGETIKPKARLVVCANMITQMFASLFAPTVNEKSMKIMFALAVIFGLIVTGIDVKGAFLYPELKRPVYISLPTRLTGLPTVYWKLDKTLYGLPDSPQAFYEDVSKLLLKNGYARTNADPCLFYMRKNGQFIMFSVHVDDFACASSSKFMTNQLLAVLRSRYIITTDDTLEAYLGINIHHNSDGSILLTQPRRLEDIFCDYKDEMDTISKRVPSIPMSTDFSDDYQDDSPPAEYTEYMSLLGKLIYIVKTRPDIAYAVNRLATRAHVATLRDYAALLRIVAYLQGTKQLGIRYFPNSWKESDGAPQLFGYLDASYASHKDSKSHTGYAFGLGNPSNACFFSRTTKQTNVTLSSTEAENAAAVEATKETLWFRQLLDDLGFHQLEPTVLYADSASMIALAENTGSAHKRVKHYITRVNFMIEQVKKGNIVLKHVSTFDNVADILTKPLGPQDFIRHRTHLLGMQ